ncbi:hypothetical protein HG530_005109 [Fusarium avenaceum]|nr:hypothetical protein HG530_005109 [Fusarium avenaceum]
MRLALRMRLTSGGRSSGLQARRQGINLLLQLRDSTIRLLLSLARRHRHDAIPASLSTPLTRSLVARVRFAAHLESTTSLTSSRTSGIGAISIVFAVLQLLVLILRRVSILRRCAGRIISVVMIIVRIVCRGRERHQRGAAAGRSMMDWRRS